MAEITGAPDLRQFVTPSRQLKFAEYCFSITMDFERRAKDIPELIPLLRIITALMNTCGGRITIESLGGNHVDHATLDTWKKDLEDKLATFVPRHICQSCVQLIDYSLPMTLLVRKSNTLITLKYYMFSRWLVGTYTIQDLESAIEVTERTSGQPYQDPFLDATELVYQDALDISEGPNLEFKFWKRARKLGKCHERDTYMWKLTEERTRKTLFALPNMPEGGALVLGVHEDTDEHTNIILGQIISETDESALPEFIDSLLKYGPGSEYRIWGMTGNMPQRGDDWAIRFIPVVGGPAKERRRLIVIHFKHFPGGVFEKSPESYTVSEDGNILDMGFQEWINKTNDSQCSLSTNMTIGSNRSPGAYKNQNPSMPTSQAHGSTVASDGQPTNDLSNEPSLPSHGDQHHHPASANSSAVSRTHHGELADRLAHREYLSWTKHRKNWQSNLKLVNGALEDSVYKLANDSRIFHLALPINFTPERTTILQSHPANVRALDDAIAHIVHSVKIPAFGIASSTWLSNIQTDVQIERPPSHMMDVFVGNSSGQFELWAIVDEPAGDVSKTWEYLHLAGRITKGKLLRYRTSSEINQKMYVGCRLLQLGKGEIKPQVTCRMSDQPKTQTYLESLKLQLAQALLEKNTYIKSIFGDELSIILTHEQLEVILTVGLDKFNHIEGPPGSGKSYIAIHLCRKLACGYLCPTSTYGKFLEFQKVRDKFIIQTSDQLIGHIENDSFSGLDLLIIDDVQRFRFSRLVWFRLFEYIANSRVKLLILGDSCYQNFEMEACFQRSHLSRIYMQEFCEENNFNPTIKALSVVHRNTKKIVSFIKSNFESDANFPEQSEISCSNSSDGDDVEIRCLVDIMISGKSNGLVKYIRSLSDAKKPMNNEQSAYEQKDVAVLVDTYQPEEDASKLRNIFSIVWGECTVHDAGTFPVTGITIDTLENFTGFDRKVCVLVTSENIMNSDKRSGRSLANPRYKTFVASRGISRVVFVADSKMTMRMADTLNLDNLPSGVRQIWYRHHLLDCYILCFVVHDNSIAILYIPSSASAIHAISLEGAAMPLTVDSQVISEFRCMDSSPDGRQVIIAGGEHLPFGPWKWSVYDVLPGLLKRRNTFDLDAGPVSVRWISDLDVVMVLHQLHDEDVIVRFSALTGEQIWRHGSSITHVHRPCRISTNSQAGSIYIWDARPVNLHELAPTGKFHRTITRALGVNPTGAISPSSTGGYLLCSGDAENDIYIVRTYDGHANKVIQTPDAIFSFRLYEDKFLGVAIKNGVVLYDVEGLF